MEPKKISPGNSLSQNKAPPKEWIVFVGNISSEDDIELLEDAFANYGQVKANFHRDHETQRFKKSAFMIYQEQANAEAAIEGMNGFNCNGQRLQVVLAEANNRSARERTDDRDSAARKRKYDEMAAGRTKMTNGMFEQPERALMKISMLSFICWTQLQPCGRRMLDSTKLTDLARLCADKPLQMNCLFASSYIEVACARADFVSVAKKTANGYYSLDSSIAKPPAVLMDGSLRFYALVKAYRNEDIKKEIKDRMMKQNVTLRFHLFKDEAATELRRFLDIPVVVRSHFKKGITAAMLRLTARLEAEAVGKEGELAQLSLGDKATLAVEGIRLLRMNERKSQFFHFAKEAEFFTELTAKGWRVPYRIANMDSTLRDLLLCKVLSHRLINLQIEEIGVLERCYEDDAAKVNNVIALIGRRLSLKEGISTSSQVKKALYTGLGIVPRARRARVASRRDQFEGTDSDADLTDEDEPVAPVRRRTQSAQQIPNIIIHNTINNVNSIAGMNHSRPEDQRPPPRQAAPLHRAIEQDTEQRPTPAIP